MLFSIFINIKEFLPYVGISGFSSVLPKYGLFLDILAYKSYICHKISYPSSENIINRENVIDILFDETIKYREYSSTYKAIGGIILVVPEEILKFLENPDGSLKLDDILNANVFKYSIGHCIIRAKQFENSKYKCGIYDVCMHQSYNSSEMFNSILIKIFSILPDDTLLWLGVDPFNTKFYNAIGLYTKYGFKNPYLTFNDPFGKKFYNDSNGIVSLTRYNDYNGLEIIDRNVVILEIIYILQQQIYLFKTGDNACFLNIFFNVTTAEYLKNLSFYSSSFNIKEKTITTKEISGSLIILPYSKEIKPNVDSNIYWEIFADGNKKTFGSELNVFFYPAKYSYHTHPKNSYKLVGIEVGFPSGLDYGAFMYNIFKEDIILHCVISLEGIYTISLNKNWTDRVLFENLYDNFIIPLLENSEYYDMFVKFYQLEHKIYVNKEIEYCDKINNITIPKHLLTYITDDKLVNNLHTIPLFNVNFLTYDDITKQKIITIYFNRRGYPSQCFISEDSINNYKNSIIEEDEDEIMKE